MHTFIAAMVVLSVLFILLLWLFLSTAQGRSGQLASAGDKLNMVYEPWRALGQNLRNAGFQVLSTGEGRYAQHWLEGDDIVLFDYIGTSNTGSSVQTLVVMPCPLTHDLRFMASLKPWIQTDCFSEHPKTTLKKIARADAPEALHQWHIAGTPTHKIRQLCNTTVINWLLTHPHLHIEWTNGMLLVCQPGYLIDAEEIETVLHDIEQLKQALNASNVH